MNSPWSVRLCTTVSTHKSRYFAWVLSGEILLSAAFATAEAICQCQPLITTHAPPFTDTYPTGRSKYGVYQSRLIRTNYRDGTVASLAFVVARCGV